ncbi:hypothetical protein EBU71_10535 [bacterium]|nr:hypothetical protein [Candidatus Elulimicrobium humile]
MKKNTYKERNMSSRDIYVPIENSAVFLRNFTTTFIQGKGEVLYASVSKNPTNRFKNGLDKRVWKFDVEGVIVPSQEEKYILRFDFSKVDIPIVYAFEDEVTGVYTLNTCNPQNARGKFEYTYNSTLKIFDLQFFKDKTVTKVSKFCFNLSIFDDATCPDSIILLYKYSVSSQPFYTYTYNENNTATLTIGTTSCVLSFTVADMPFKDTIQIVNSTQQQQFYIGTYLAYIVSSSLTFFQPPYFQMSSFFIEISSGDAVTAYNFFQNFYFPQYTVTPYDNILYYQAYQAQSPYEQPAYEVFWPVTLGLTTGSSSLQVFSYISNSGPFPPQPPYIVPNPYFLVLYDTAYNLVTSYISNLESTLQISYTSSGWTSSQFDKTSSFTALIQDTSLNFLTGFINLTPPPCGTYITPCTQTQKNMNNATIWTFTQQQSGNYTIQVNSYQLQTLNIQQDQVYMTAICTTDNTPCMSTSSYEWTLSSVITSSSTNPFVATIQAVDGGEFNNYYLSESCPGASQDPCMDKQQPYSWTIIPVVIGEE